MCWGCDDHPSQGGTRCPACGDKQGIFAAAGCSPRKIACQSCGWTFRSTERGTYVREKQYLYDLLWYGLVEELTKP